MALTSRDNSDSPPLEPSLKDMHLEDEAPTTSTHHLQMLTPHTTSSTSSTSNTAPSSPKTHLIPKFPSASPVKSEETMASPVSEVVGATVTVKQEPGKAPKLSRTASKKITARPAPLFDHLEDSTGLATSSFQVITDCVYGSKNMGSSEHDALDCDCTENWNGAKNLACDDDSDCINRATKMECLDNECNCGPHCQNQRFQHKQYATVSVIQTEKKGFGLRCDKDLQPNDFIFEYIGDVINETQFRKRMIQYDEQGIKHFYFMSLSKNEFIDATKRGNLGRFCNHSCNPNCYVDKWVVGDKFRMGIFAERSIKAGEELVFNYNVDRYGADPQPCYCGEPNCTGYIGGKTQTERATKLSTQVLEALGIDDGDGWDTAVSKRPRKKKAGEDDEEYVNNVDAKALDMSSVTKVVASLMQSKEKWIAVKLLSRIQYCDSDTIRNRVVRMHGYVAFKTTLTTFGDDANVILQVLDILYRMPRLTRNKIQDAKIEPVIEALRTHEDKRVQEQADLILKAWAKLELGYRIPRRKEQEIPRNTFERRGSNGGEKKARKQSESPKAPKGPSQSTPSGPKYINAYTPARPSNSRLNAPPLPRGWFAAPTTDGRTYYYSVTCPDGTWTRPDKPAVAPPPPPKAPSSQQKLNDIVAKIVEEAEAQKAAQKAAQEQRQNAAPKEPQNPKEKWRSYTFEKQKKVYENTVFPSIIYVLDKYKRKLPKEDLKRFGKEVSKLISTSDYKHKRVQDPTKITSKQEKQIKTFTKDFLDKAVSKKKVRDKQKAEKTAEKHKLAKAGDKKAAAELKSEEAKEAAKAKEEELNGEDNIKMSDFQDEMEDVKASPLVPASESSSPSGPAKRKRDDESDSPAFPEGTPTKRVKSESPPPSADLSPSAGLKRKRESPSNSPADNHGTPSKRLRSASPPSLLAPPPPPPPPPPPTNGGMEVDPIIGLQDQADSLAAQESLKKESADPPLEPQRLSNGDKDEGGCDPEENVRVEGMENGLDR
ncbi:MAG: histone methyltransferase set2 [Vezdaea aestivalis]|nr:MAG: histone methyltransferase set2 [Vezdaea aestivalis]